VALGDIDGKPFSVAKIAAYMRVPRTTVMRRLRFSGMNALMTREAAATSPFAEKFSPRGIKQTCLLVSFDFRS
jgi:hypothetical protein